METYKYNYLHSLIISNLGPVPWLALIQFLFFWGFIPLDLTVMATYSGDKLSQEKRYNGQRIKLNVFKVHFCFPTVCNYTCVCFQFEKMYSKHIGLFFHGLSAATLKGNVLTLVSKAFVYPLVSTRYLN